MFLQKTRKRNKTVYDVEMLFVLASPRKFDLIMIVLYQIELY